MEAHKRLLFTYALFFVVVVSLLALTRPNATEATAYILRVECGNATITVPLDGQVRVAYTWIHSVEKTPITEVYKVTPQGLILVEAMAQSFGAGHPYSSSEIGGNNTKILGNGTIAYEANYNIGMSLEIIGHPDYEGIITIHYGGSVLVCREFTKATITVERASKDTS